MFVDLQIIKEMVGNESFVAYRQLIGYINNVY